MSKEVWRPVVPLLAREREVVAIDLPGFGASPPGPHSVEGLARAVAAFADELGLERPHVAGNSLGGGIALALGASGRVRSTCAVSPVGYAAGREIPYARGALATTRVVARAIDPIAPALARNRVARTMLSAHVAARPWRIPAEDAAQWARAVAHATSFWGVLRSARDWAPNVPVCPATVAWGERDWLLIFSRQAPRARRRCRTPATSSFTDAATCRRGTTRSRSPACCWRRPRARPAGRSLRPRASAAA